MKNRVGEKWITNQGYLVEITQYISSKNCTIQFEDGSTLSNLYFVNIVKGKVSNPNHKSVNGVGCVGKGFKNLTKTICYMKWADMLKRTHNKKYLLSRPKYLNVTVCNEWLDFSSFADWFNKKYNSEIMQDWHLDKDLLSKGNKIYSPETCCFIPLEINSIFVSKRVRKNDLPRGIGKVKERYRVRVANKHYGYFDTVEEAFQAYKIAKEAYIKEVADKWQPYIEPKVYIAMYNYEVEITD